MSIVLAKYTAVGDLSDCAIESADGHIIPAHRVILSATSGLFCDMFKQCDRHNPYDPYGRHDLYDRYVVDREPIPLPFNHDIIAIGLYILYNGAALCPAGTPAQLAALAEFLSYVDRLDLLAPLRTSPDELLRYIGDYYSGIYHIDSDMLNKIFMRLIPTDVFTLPCELIRNMYLALEGLTEARYKFARICLQIFLGEIPVDDTHNNPTVRLYADGRMLNLYAAAIVATRCAYMDVFTWDRALYSMTPTKLTSKFLSIPLEDYIATSDECFEALQDMLREGRTRDPEWRIKHGYIVRKNRSIYHGTDNGYKQQTHEYYNMPPKLAYMIDQIDYTSVDKVMIKEYVRGLYKYLKGSQPPRSPYASASVSASVSASQPVPGTELDNALAAGHGPSPYKVKFPMKYALADESSIHYLADTIDPACDTHRDVINIVINFVALREISATWIYSRKCGKVNEYRIGVPLPTIDESFYADMVTDYAILQSLHIYRAAQQVPARVIGYWVGCYSDKRSASRRIACLIQWGPSV